MKRMLIGGVVTIIVMVVLLSILLSTCKTLVTNIVDTTDSIKNSYIGYHVVLSDDTLLIINSDSFGEEYTLENGNVVDIKMLRKSKILK